MEPWTQDRRIATLYLLPAEVFALAQAGGFGGLCLRHRGGDRGYLSLEDGLAGQYLVRHHGTGTVGEAFGEPADVVAAGWVLE